MQITYITSSIFDITQFRFELIRQALYRLYKHNQIGRF